MDFKQLAQKLELDESEYIELIELFVTTSTNDIAKLEKAIAEKNTENGERAAHSLKGSSASLGLNDISDSARFLEKKTREGSMENATDLLENIKNKINFIKSLIEK